MARKEEKFLAQLSPADQRRYRIRTDLGMSAIRKSTREGREYSLGLIRFRRAADTEEARKLVESYASYRQLTVVNDLLDKALTRATPETITIPLDETGLRDGEVPLFATAETELDIQDIDAAAYGGMVRANNEITSVLEGPVPLYPWTREMMARSKGETVELIGEQTERLPTNLEGVVFVYHYPENQRYPVRSIEVAPLA